MKPFVSLVIPMVMALAPAALAEEAAAQAPANRAATASGVAAAAEPEAVMDVATPQPAPGMPKLVLTNVDSPKVRLRSASSRATGQTWPQVYTLAPKRRAPSVSAQPSLFWYVDAAPPAQATVLFTLIDDAQDAPVAQLQLDTPEQAGIQRIRLAEHSVTLEPGIAYEWTVSLVVDERWSHNPSAVGGIVRVDAPETLAALPWVSGGAHAYAEAGLWYDAFTSVSDMIDAAPGDSTLVEVRNSLLLQVGLEEVVAGR